MERLLNEEIPVTTAEVTKILEEKKEGKSEFKEKKEWLPFENFQTEVRRSMYPGKGDVQEWYKKEKKKHPNWSSSPDIMYKDKGWEGWSELVGIENRLKKEWPSFEDFQTETRALYPGKGDVHEWYRRERKKHHNWSSNPNRIYKDRGWQGWSELVEKENPNEKNFLSFENFKKEIMELYDDQKNIDQWYQEEKKKHANWSSNPNKIYPDFCHPNHQY